MWLITIVVIICFAFGFAMGYMYYKYNRAEEGIDKLDRKVNLFTDETRMKLFGLIKKIDDMEPGIDDIKSNIEKMKNHIVEIDTTVLKRKDLEGVGKIIMGGSDKGNGYN